MQLPNTREYYRDLALYYFNKEHLELMNYFRELSQHPRYTYSESNTRDWFANNV